MKIYYFLILLSLNPLFAQCKKCTSSCEKSCLTHATGYSELKSCQAHCMDHNAINYPKEKYSDRNKERDMS